MTPTLYEASKSALHVVQSSGRILKAGRATLFVWEQLGYRWMARILRVPPLVWGVELGYHLVASHRKFFSRVLFRGDREDEA